MSSENSAALPPHANSKQPIWMKLLVAFSVVVGLLLLVAWLVVLPAIRSGREENRRSLCAMNLRQLGMALAQYQQTYRCYPPAYVADENGKPMHSWRVLLLPFLGDPKSAQLYKQYDFSEPWDGPHNRRLSAVAPEAYRCPSADRPPDQTNYVAVVGDETIWPGPRAVTYLEMLGGDGPSVTVAFVETADAGINWLEPRDLALDEVLHANNSQESSTAISSKHPAGVNVVFCDARIEFLPADTTPERWRALLTRNGGEERFP